MDEKRLALAHPFLCAGAPKGRMPEELTGAARANREGCFPTRIEQVRIKKLVAEVACAPRASRGRMSFLDRHKAAGKTYL